MFMCFDVESHAEIYCLDSGKNLPHLLRLVCVCWTRVWACWMCKFLTEDEHFFYVCNYFMKIQKLNSRKMFLPKFWRCVFILKILRQTLRDESICGRRQRWWWCWTFLRPPRPHWETIAFTRWKTFSQSRILFEWKAFVSNSNLKFSPNTSIVLDYLLSSSSFAQAFRCFRIFEKHLPFPSNRKFPHCNIPITFCLLFQNDKWSVRQHSLQPANVMKTKSFSKKFIISIGLNYRFSGEWNLIEIFRFNCINGIFRMHR